MRSKECSRPDRDRQFTDFSPSTRLVKHCRLKRMNYRVDDDYRSKAGMLFVGNPSPTKSDPGMHAQESKDMHASGRGDKPGVGETTEYKIVEDDWTVDLPQNPGQPECDIYMTYGGCEYVLSAGSKAKHPLILGIVSFTRAEARMGTAQSPSSGFFFWGCFSGM